MGLALLGQDLVIFICSNIAAFARARTNYEFQPCPLQPMPLDHTATINSGTDFSIGRPSVDYYSGMTILFINMRLYVGQSDGKFA